jgi:hypothetical protein
VVERNREEFGKREMCKKKVIEDKESYKWITGIKAGQAFSEDTGRKLIHLLDREADIGEVINLFLKDQPASGFIIRARHNRSTLTNTQRNKVEDVSLFLLFKQISESDQRKKINRVLRNKESKAYEATCWLRYAKYKFRSIDKEITCVHLEEVASTDESKMTG